MSCSSFPKMKLSAHDAKLAERILTEINGRLQTMMDVGLGYLTLNRVSSTLSGGETQRINLTRTLGSNLTQSLYILDEPSVGPPQRHRKPGGRTQTFTRSGQHSCCGGTRRKVIRNADYIIEIGPWRAAMAVNWSMRDPTKNFWKVRPSQRSTSLANNRFLCPPSGAQQPIKSALWAAGSTTSKTLMLTYPCTPWPWWVVCRVRARPHWWSTYCIPALPQSQGRSHSRLTRQTRSTRGRPQDVNSIRNDQPGSHRQVFKIQPGHLCQKPTTASENCTATNPCQGTWLWSQTLFLQRRRRKMQKPARAMATSP